jgi:hypothetical protein
MKSSLWMIIALVTGIVGFLVGYSVSGFTGSRAAQTVAHGGPAPHDDAPAARPTGVPAAPEPRTAAGGYGGAGAHDAKASAPAGSGAVQPAAQVRPEKAAEKPKAAGY